MKYCFIAQGTTSNHWCWNMMEDNEKKNVYPPPHTHTQLGHFAVQEKLKELCKSAIIKKCFKWTEDLNIHFSKDKQIAQQAQYVQHHSSSGKCKSKPQRYITYTVRMVIIKKTSSVHKDIEKKNVN